MRVLLIEDSKRLRESLSVGLRRAGYALDTAGDGVEGLWFAETHDYDVIILDLMLPGMDGLSVLRRLREAGRNVHVLILTARDAVEDRVTGLQSGADDYLVKPFSFDELLARLQALVRRAYQVKNPQLRVGDLVIDTAARTVRRGDEVIALAPREYALLEYLALRQGQVVSRTEIEHHIYDERAEPMSNVVDAAVYALRRKIDRPGTASLIQTRRGMGYLLRPADSCDPSADT
ncbi:MAG: response regulator transcription factor [Candidatus Sumerlaeia bacterium]